jgi:hypothetical protein
VDEEAKAALDFAEQLAGHRLLLARQLERGEEGAGLGDGKPRELHQRLGVHPHRARFRP